MKHHHFELPTFQQFLYRWILNILIGLVLIVVALLVGMWGYHRYEGMPWVDAFANASMILSGMGPLTPLTAVSGKIFAGFYALFSGLFFIVAIAIIFGPLVHRFLHKIHLTSIDRNQ